jgi:DNA polymerase (family 10)
LKNSEIGGALRNLGFYAETEDGANSQFKARAYYRAADVVDALHQRLDEVYAEKGVEGLLEIPSIGKAIAGKIEEMINTGAIRNLEEARARLPVDVEQFRSVEGLGPKTVKLLYEKLGVRNLGDLEKAASDGKLQGVAGFTPKRIKEMQARISYYRQGSRRRLLGEVYPLAKQIEKRLGGLPGVQEAITAGSVRRMKETVGDIDFLVCTPEHNSERVMESFVTMPEVDEVMARGQSKSFVRLAGKIDADLLVVPPESWGSALQYFTGSKEHSVHVRRIATEKGLRLNEWGLYRDSLRVAGASEAEVYRALGMDWIPPELREDSGEIELALSGGLPQLVQYGSIQGDLQVHSESTDGTASIEEMARAGREFGLKYIAITDHTKSLALTGGLDEEELLDQAERIWAMKDRIEGIEVLASAEVNIMKDGSLDIADSVLDRLDIVGAAIHSNFALPIEDQTKRIVSAIRNPSVDIIFHPTGRRINKREGYPVDIQRIVSEAKETGTVLEVDAHYDRLDLRDEHVRMAVEQGVKLSIDSDAHHPIHYSYLMLGVGQARRGWAKASDVINTATSAKQVLKALK